MRFCLDDPAAAEAEESRIYLLVRSGGFGLAGAEWRVPAGITAASR